MPARRLAAATLVMLLAGPAAAFDTANLNLTTGQDCSGCDLSGMDLRGRDLSSVTLNGADLRGADLSNTDLRAALLQGAQLQGAKLIGANLAGAHLGGANLDGARLDSAEVAGADFTGASLQGTDVTGIRTDRTMGADLSGVIDRTTRPVAQPAPPSEARGDFVMGTMFLAAFDYCPPYSHEADGTALPVSSNNALYSLYGNTYGGDSKTFNLPDLRRAVPLPAMRYCIILEGVYPTVD